MLESFPVSILVGTLLGFLAALGVGGGSLLLLWLTLVLPMPPEAARSINLLFFLPGALISSLLRRKQGTLQWKIILPAALAGSAAAAVVSALRPETALLRKLFGGLLIVTGLRELFYKPRTSQRKGP